MTSSRGQRTICCSCRLRARGTVRGRMPGPWQDELPKAAAAWRADEAALVSDAGRLAQCLRCVGPGAVRRLALEEAASLS